MGLSRGWGTISQEHMCHCLYALLSRRRQPPGEEPHHPLREMATPHTSRSRGKHRNRRPWNPLGDPPTQHTHTADLAKPTFCEPGEGGGLSQWTVGLYACAAFCCYLVILRTSLREEDADGRPSVGAFALPLPIGAGSPAPPPKTQTAASPTPQHAGSTAPLAVRGRQWHKSNTILRRQ